MPVMDGFRELIVVLAALSPPFQAPTVDPAA